MTKFQIVVRTRDTEAKETTTQVISFQPGRITEKEVRKYAMGLKPIFPELTTTVEIQRVQVLSKAQLRYVPEKKPLRAKRKRVTV